MAATAATGTTPPTPKTGAHAPTPHRPSGGHGELLRGLMYTPISPFTQGRFGRMFRMLPAAEYGNSDSASIHNLELLAAQMSLKPDDASTGTASPATGAESPATGAASPATDSPDPNDQPDARESGIPALYTYFGQFVDHDITYDPSSLMQKRNDPDSMVDYRTPAFDLDSLYGRGPSDDPYMYDILNDPGSAASFLLGSPLFQQSDSDTTQKKDPDGWDIPRNRVKDLQKRALIGDPRNDENTIVSQLHGLFLCFHNQIIAESKNKPSFGYVQQQVRFHYEYLILHDFLPRIVNCSILEALKTDDLYDRDKLKFYRWKDIPYMPIEFSVAAYRMGHSMIRESYRLNDGNVRPVFSTTPPDSATNPNPDLRGFQPLPGTWALDWGRFVDTDIRPYSGSATDNKRRLQFAFKIGTSLVDPLAKLPDMGAVGGPKSLAQRNLERGYRLRLPSGQSVAHAMGIPEDQVLKDEEIAIGPNKTLITQLSSAFKGNCPLWTYILAEAMKHAEDVAIPVTGTDPTTITTPKLGPVGGRIVAEVFLGLMFGDPNSMLNLYPNWRPNPGSTESYTLKDFVLYALRK